MLKLLFSLNISENQVKCPFLLKIWPPFSQEILTPRFPLSMINKMFKNNLMSSVISAA